MAAKFGYKASEGGRGIRWLYEHTRAESEGFLCAARVMGTTNARKLLIYMKIP